MSEESVHKTEIQQSNQSGAADLKLDKETEFTEETAKKDSTATLDDINIALNGEIDDTTNEVSINLMEDLPSFLSNSDSTQPLIQEDSNVSDNETQCENKDVEVERTSDAKPSEGEREQKELGSDSEESDFVDAEAINGVEMLPSSMINDENSDSSDKIDSATENTSEKQTEKETDVHDDAVSPLVCNDTTKESHAENTESSNEETSEEPELQFITEGSQDDLLPSSTDAAAESSCYETPRTSDASPSATSESQSNVVTEQPTVNGVSSRNSVTVTDSAPIAPPRKNKKKGVPKGLSSSSLGGCFPMACAGNTSPAFTLSRGDSVYGGSVRSRSVA